MNIFNYVKSRVAILDVVKEYASLKRAGIYWKGKCPFHNEKTGSFTVSPHREIFYCFGCQVGGDVITFISQAERCSQLEAAKLLAERFGIDLPEEIIHGNPSELSHSEKERYEKACMLVARWCNNQLAHNAQAQAYVTNRGVSQATIKQFCLGYFPQGSHTIKQLLEYVQKENILAADLINSNILFDGKHGLYSPFEERLIFPIKDHLGRFCGFGGRTIKHDDPRPKYYNSHDHPLFAKGTVLFGLDSAKKAIQKENSVFLVEGYIDCIIMAQAGFANTVATLGTACTLEHLQQLSRYAQKMCVVYDGDAAGKKAITRLVSMCWQVDLDLTVISLPTTEDPASYITSGNNFGSLIAHAQDIFSFYIQEAGQNFASQPLHERLTRVRGILETICQIHDPLKKDLLLQKAASTLGLTVEVLKQELKRIQSPYQKHNHQEFEKTDKNQPKRLQQTNLPVLEKKLFSAILMHNGDCTAGNIRRLLDFLPHPLNNLLHLYFTCKEQAKTQKEAFDCFFQRLSGEEKHITSEALASLDQEATSELVAELFEQFRKKQWKTIVNDVKLKLAEAQKNADSIAVQKILDNFQQLRQEFMPKDRVW